MESVMKEDAEESATEGESSEPGADAVNGGPKDTDPTGQPLLDPDDLQINPPVPPAETEDTDRPDPEKSA